ncbi:MAG TPA: hypothetical protein VNN73_20565 [Blastocatellia bacterium]|nr:hypothetical protein [Blastocatellia bacterium]
MVKTIFALLPDVEKCEGKIAIIARKGYFAPKGDKRAGKIVKRSPAP